MKLHQQTNTRFRLVPLCELLAIEGWQMRFEANLDGSGTLRAENPHLREALEIRAASEAAAVDELAFKRGWRMSHEHRTARPRTH